ncbi:MAG: hypothetical protein M1812_004039 [Candelaria pacifica]|nr:MAG: hypothetical protein M1812_004039 [Candelaria pacifica]
MPPKKKARVPSRAASTPSSEGQLKVAPTPVSGTTPKKSEAADVLQDPWTDEQETSLFKGMIRWIPTGMHKHFRMIAISQQLRNHGYTSQQDSHTKIPGIWEKLGTLYNLEALDERDNSLAEEDAEEEGEPAKAAYFPFELPEEDYGDLMFDRRLAPDGSSSPSSMQETQTPAQKRKAKSEASTTGARRASTIEDTEEGISPFLSGSSSGKEDDTDFATSKGNAEVKGSKDKIHAAPMNIL